MTDTALQFLTDLRALRHVLDLTERRVAEDAQGTKYTALDIQTLDLVLEHPGLRSGRLAMLLGVVPTTASSTVSRLRRKSLLSVRTDASDRRAVTLWLTAAGDQMARRLRSEALARMDTALATLPHEDQTRLVHLFARVVREGARDETASG